MFDELNKYSNQGNFFFIATDSLVEVCNIPVDKYGIYVAYALKHGRIELIYIGKSGFTPKVDIEGRPSEEIDDIRESLLTGYQFGDIERKHSWPVQMMIEDIEALHIHWYVTFDAAHHDLPAYMQNKILQIYQGIYGAIPRWNQSD